MGLPAAVHGENHTSVLQCTLWWCVEVCCSAHTLTALTYTDGNGVQECRERDGTGTKLRAGTSGFNPLVRKCSIWVLLVYNKNLKGASPRYPKAKCVVSKPMLHLPLPYYHMRQ